MGMTLPDTNSTMSSTPAEEARQLIQRKQALEAELDAQTSILRANKVTMQTPLVDAQGFPRDDIDIWNVRVARVRIIELRNDLSALTIELGKVLEKVYDPNNAAESNATTTGTAAADSSRVQEDVQTPFAKVNAVAPGSPATEAVSFSYRGVYPESALIST
jgi:26S proteasome regulatory subunit N4